MNSANGQAIADGSVWYMFWTNVADELQLAALTAGRGEGSRRRPWGII